MSDHWNSLADKLGTPSLVPHQRKPSAKPKELTKSSVEPAAPSKVEVTNAEANVVAPTELDSPSEPKSEAPSRIRSSWDSVARLFGVGSAPEPSPALEELVSGSKPASSDTINSLESTSASADPFEGFGKKKDRKAASMWGESTPAAPALVLSAKEDSRSAPTVAKADPAPKKKKGFWDTVEDAVEPEPEVAAREIPKGDPVPPRSRHSEGPRSQSSRQDSRRPAREDSRPESRSDRPKPLDDDLVAGDSEDREVPSGDEPERRGRRRNIRRGRGNEAGDQPIRDEVSSERDLATEPEDSETRPAARHPEREPRAPRESRHSQADRPQADRPQADRPQADRPRGERTQEDRPQSERTQSERTQGERPRGGRSSSESRSSESRSPESRSSEPRSPEPRSPESRSSEARNDSRSSESRPPRPPRSSESEPAARERDDSRTERPRPPNRTRSDRSEASGGESRERPPRADRTDRPARPDTSAARTPPRPAAKRGWDDLDSIDEADEAFVEVDGDVDDENDFEGSVDKEASTSDETRKRKRRRRGGTGRRPAAEEASSDDSSPATASGRQVYGRHADDDDTDDDGDSLDRGFQVTAWADAIASIIDRNMENHKRPSSNDYRGRGGNRNNGSSRRRN